DRRGPRHARQRVRPDAETQVPAAAPEPEQSELRRVRLAGREAHGGADQDGAHRPGLHRGDERTDRARHRAGAAERLAGAGATAVQAAVPERDRWRAARAAAERRVAVNRVELLVRGALTACVVYGACRKAEPAPLYQKIAVEHRDIVVSATASGVIQPILTL